MSLGLPARVCPVRVRPRGGHRDIECARCVAGGVSACRGCSAPELNQPATGRERWQTPSVGAGLSFVGQSGGSHGASSADVADAMDPVRWGVDDRGVPEAVGVPDTGEAAVGTEH